MARRGDVLGVSGAETMIGSGVVANGQLTSDGDMLVDGIVEGDIQAVGNVLIGVNGEVTANVRGDNVTVSGHLRGNITATGELTITDTGQVRGDITAASLAIASGGIFIGTSSMREATPLTPNLQTSPQDEETN